MEATSKTPERVIFRVWNEDDDVIAFFPDTFGDSTVCNFGMMMSYMHVGQHGDVPNQEEC